MSGVGVGVGWGMAALYNVPPVSAVIPVKWRNIFYNVFTNTQMFNFAIVSWMFTETVVPHPTFISCN